MKQTSTQDLLILHTYGETTFEQKEQLATLLADNESLQAELFELMQMAGQLDGVKSPSATSLRIIMDYSYKTEHLQAI